MSSPITAVYVEESPLYDGQVMVSVVRADGSIAERHLNASVAPRYVRTVRAKMGRRS